VADTAIKRLLIRLQELRKIHRLTQEAFSELSGISYKYYQAVEAGRKRDLRLSTLERIARAYDMEVYQLLAPTLSRRGSKILSRKSSPVKSVR
jgi:transcriptional regulator with XRE-family HTH domain